MVCTLMLLTSFPSPNLSLLLSLADCQCSLFAHLCSFLALTCVCLCPWQTVSALHLLAFFHVFTCHPYALQGVSVPHLLDHILFMFSLVPPSMHNSL